MAHKLTYERPDGSKTDWDLTGLEDAAYERGLAEGKRRVNNADGTTQLLNQIAGMQRQIDDSHDALRRRNALIRELEARLNRITGSTCTKEFCPCLNHYKEN